MTASIYLIENTLNNNKPYNGKIESINNLKEFLRNNSLHNLRFGRDDKGFSILNKITNNFGD